MAKLQRAHTFLRELACGRLYPTCETYFYHNLQLLHQSVFFGFETTAKPISTYTGVRVRLSIEAVW